MILKNDLESRAGISMAAPTIEAFSNTDNVSEDRSIYKNGKDRVMTLDRGSPTQSPLMRKKPLYQVENDFKITVVSQRIHSR